MTSRSRILVLASAALLVALPAFSAIYTVTLKNGTTFDTRYQPERASWDPAKLLFLTEWGNEISLAIDDVASITTDTESRGFGHQLNATTIALGWAPNDQLVPGSEEYQAAETAARQDAALQALASPVYDTKQFVEPNQSGGGIPVWMTGYNSVPQVSPQPVQPAQPPQ